GRGGAWRAAWWWGFGSRPCVVGLSGGPRPTLLGGPAMTRWQLTGLVVGAAALLFTARPAQAQVWARRPAPIVVARPPIVIAPPPIVVGRPTPPVWPVPPIGVVPTPPVSPVPPIGFVPPVQPVPPTGFVRGPVGVGPGWGAGPGDVRRAYRAARRGGWYGPAWGSWGAW